MGEKPDIGKMIEEEMAKFESEKPAAEGGELDKDVDKAFETLEEQGAKDEAKEAIRSADMGAEFARRIQVAFEKGDTKGLEAMKKDYAEKGGDTAMLREQLKAYHDAYLEAGLKEKAAEIDAFSRSLESRSEVGTQAGKEFLAKLDAGGFASMEEAINDLSAIKDREKGADEEALNAEFNVLYAKINEKFLGGKKEAQNFDMGDDDIDAALGGL
jgi:hypothetical protein